MKKKSVKPPSDLVLEGKTIAFVKYDERGLPSIKITEPWLIGARSGTKLSKWLEKASNWVTYKGGV